MTLPSLVGIRSPRSSGLQVPNAPHVVAERGVAFFRDQELTVVEQRELGRRLGELSGKPASSGLHVHPLTETTSELGNEISVISSERRRYGFYSNLPLAKILSLTPNLPGLLSEYTYGDKSKFASGDW